MRGMVARSFRLLGVWLVAAGATPLGCSPDPVTVQVGRSAAFQSCGFADADHAGDVFVFDERPDVLVWRSCSEIGLGAELPLPFDRAGVPHYLGSSRFLVSGVRSSDAEASILVVRLDHESWKIDVEQQREYGRVFDPYGVLWNPVDRMLYVLDFRKRLLAAEWDGRGLPAAREFSVVAMRDRCLPLLDGSSARLHRPPEDAPGVTVASGSGMCGNCDLAFASDCVVQRRDGEWVVEQQMNWVEARFARAQQQDAEERSK